MANQDFSQVKIDDTGTYGAVNTKTSEAVAFPSQETFMQFFGPGAKFDPNAPKASFDTSSLLGSNAGQIKSISLGSLTPATALELPATPPQANPTETATSGATETSKSLESYIKELTPPETETSKKYDSLVSELQTLLPGLKGRGEEQVKKEEEAGLPDLKKKLAEINAQILSKVAETTKTNASYEQLIQSLENQNIPMGLIIGQQAQARKLQLAEANSKSADLGLLQAVAAGLQGNITAMQQGIDRAIDLKYQDRESELNVKLEQLKLLEGKLTKEEERTKTALERKYNEEQEKIKEEKSKSKENVNLAFSANIQTQFTNKNGEFFRTSDGKPAGTPEEFFAMAGVKSFEEAYRRGLVTDLNAERVADLEFINTARANYPDANIKLTDTAEQVAAKVRSSAKYRKETYIEPTTGSYSIVTDSFGNVRVFNNRTGQFVDSPGTTPTTPTDDRARLIQDSFASIAPWLTDGAKKSVNANISNKIARGDFEGAKSDIIGAAISAIPVEQQNKAFGRNQALDALDDIQRALDEYSSAGGNTGFLKGSYENIIKNLGKTSDPKLVDVAQRITLAMIAYRNAVSGAAFTESELKQYEQLFPSIKGNTELNKAKIDSLKSVFNLNQKSVLRTVLGDRNYDSLTTDPVPKKDGSFQFKLPDGQNAYFDNRDQANKAFEEIYGIKNAFSTAGKPQASTPTKSKYGFNDIFGGVKKYFGSSAWSKGLDYVAKKGTPIPSFASGLVEKAGFEKGWGNTVVVNLGNGIKARLSHLDQMFVKPGQQIDSKMIVGTIGNTGNVLKSDGSKPTAKELAAGRGAHLDLTLYRNGKPLSAKEVDQYINSLG